MSRVLKTYNDQVTFTYAEHCKKCDAKQGWARGTDVVGQTDKVKNKTDYIIAHSSGTIIKVVDYVKGNEVDKDGMGYGNYVAILSDNNYLTLYAHMINVSKLTVGNKIAKGTILGYIGNTGNSFGAHLHFEVRKYRSKPNASNLHDEKTFEWINSQDYLNKDLPSSTPSPSPSPTKYIAGTKVTLNNTNCYNSESDKTPYAQKSGTYYLWDNVVSNNRIKITNSKSKVRVKGQVTCWCNVKDLKFDSTKQALTRTSYPDYPKGSKQYYRVRKSFNDSNSSLGSFEQFGNAFDEWNKNKTTYHIYDNSGKQLD